MSKDIEVKTSNGELSGTIEVGKRFVGKTSNANVDLRVALVDEEEFSVDIQSSNKNVHVVYVEQPRGSSLNSFVRTSNGKIRVDHDSHFSGEFLVRSLSFFFILELILAFLIDSGDNVKRSRNASGSIHPN